MAGHHYLWQKEERRCRTLWDSIYFIITEILDTLAPIPRTLLPPEDAHVETTPDESGLGGLGAKQDSWD